MQATIVPLHLLLQEPALGLGWVAAILVAIAVHEWAHAAVATWLGDTTARAAGRLTLNPLAHVDVLGFAMLLLVGFGWGRPVPYDPRNFRDRRWGSVAVALAGPMANLALAAAVVGILAAMTAAGILAPNNLLVLTLGFLLRVSLVLLIFNCIPIPPLDGSRVLLTALERWGAHHAAALLETHGPLLLLGLVILDQLTGGGVLGALLSAVLRPILAVF